MSQGHDKYEPQYIPNDTVKLILTKDNFDIFIEQSKKGKIDYCSYGTHHLPDTAVTSHGDSGGGFFVNNKLVAINSFAFWTSSKSKTLIHGHSKLNLAKEFIINTIKN